MLLIALSAAAAAAMVLLLTLLGLLLLRMKSRTSKSAEGGGEGPNKCARVLVVNYTEYQVPETPPFRGSQSKPIELLFHVTSLETTTLRRDSGDTHLFSSRSSCSSSSSSFSTLCLLYTSSSSPVLLHRHTRAIPPLLFNEPIPSLPLSYSKKKKK